MEAAVAAALIGSLGGTALGFFGNWLLQHGRTSAERSEIRRRAYADFAATASELIERSGEAAEAQVVMFRLSFVQSRQPRNDEHKETYTNFRDHSLEVLKLRTIAYNRFLIARHALIILTKDKAHRNTIGALFDEVAIVRTPDARLFTLSENANWQTKLDASVQRQIETNAYCEAATKAINGFLAKVADSRFV